MKLTLPVLIQIFFYSSSRAPASGKSIRTEHGHRKIPSNNGNGPITTTTIGLSPCDN